MESGGTETRWDGIDARRERGRGRRRSRCAVTLAIVIALDVSGGTAVTRASPERTTEADRFVDRLHALSRTLVRWVGEASGYDVTAVLDDMPRVLFVPIGSRLDFGGGPVIVEPNMRGAYHPKANLVVLVLPRQLERTLDRGVLLHELVHAVQPSAR